MCGKVVPARSPDAPTEEREARVSTVTDLFGGARPGVIYPTRMPRTWQG